MFAVHVREILKEEKKYIVSGLGSFWATMKIAKVLPFIKGKAHSMTIKIILQGWERQSLQDFILIFKFI